MIYKYRFEIKPDLENLRQVFNKVFILFLLAILPVLKGGFLVPMGSHLSETSN